MKAVFQMHSTDSENFVHIERVQIKRVPKVQQSPTKEISITSDSMWNYFSNPFEHQKPVKLKSLFPLKVNPKKEKSIFFLSLI